MNSSPSLPFHSLPTILMITACAALSACQRSEGDPANEADPANESSFNLPAVPLPQPPMDRDALLTAVAHAASASATGLDDSAEQRKLDGARFELRIRFGCRGPAPQLDEAVFGWTFDREDRTLRVRAMPTISGENRIVQRVAGEEIEAVEGFWIPRPWLLEPVCPAAAAVRPAQALAPAEPVEPAAEREDGEQSDALRPTAPAPVEDAQETEAPPPAWPKIGIAQFYTETDARTHRRDMRPYEIVETLDADQPLGSQGYNLVLSGRLQALPGQGVISCVSHGPDNPPDCIISADFDRVWIERPETQEILAEWGSG